MLRRIQGGLSWAVVLTAAMAAGQTQSQPAPERQLPAIAPQCTYLGKLPKIPNGENIPVYCKKSPAPSEIAEPLQTSPPANPNADSDAKSTAAQSQTAAPAQSAPPDAPAAGPQRFAFPEEDSKTKELPGQHAQPAPVPDAPVPDAPQSAGARPSHPYPGDTQAPADAPPDGPGGYSSSSDNASGNPDAGTLPDAPVRKKLTLEDAGSSGHVDTGRAEKDMSVADFYIKDGNYAGAYLRYKDAVVFDPDNADAHFGLAEMARKTNKPAAEAIEQYSAVLKIDPQNKHAKEARKALSELQPPAKK